MSLYTPVWSEIPSQQRAGLSPEPRQAFDVNDQCVKKVIVLRIIALS